MRLVQGTNGLEIATLLDNNLVIFVLDKFRGHELMKLVPEGLDLLGCHSQLVAHDRDGRHAVSNRFKSRLLGVWLETSL